MNKLKLIRKISLLLAAALFTATMPVFAVESIANSGNWHSYSDILLEDEFQGEFTWSTTKTTNSPAVIPYPDSDSALWRGCSSKTVFNLTQGVKNPVDGVDKMLKISFPHDVVEGDVQKSFWFDHANQKITDTRSGITVFEQKLYFDSEKSFINGRRDEDYFMCQMCYVNDAGKTVQFIPYVIRPDGVTAVSLSSTPSGNGVLTLPRNEWIKMVTMMDYDNNKWYTYLVKEDGTQTNVTSGNYPIASYPKPTEYTRLTYTDFVEAGENSWVGIGSVKVYKYAKKSDYWKKFADINWNEDFEGKSYADNGKTTGTKYFKDADNNDFIQYNTGNPSFSVVADPTGENNEVAQIKATFKAANTASNFWYAQSNLMPQNSNLTKLHIYEQKYYLTDNVFENNGNIFWQVWDAGGKMNGVVFLCMWKDGFNNSASNSAVADSNKYTIPKNEWFTLRAVIDPTSGKTDVYVIRANGKKDFVYTATLPALKSGLGKVRAQNNLYPKNGESISIYIDDIRYYTKNSREFIPPLGLKGVKITGDAEVGKKLSAEAFFENSKAPYAYNIQWCRADAGVYNYIENPVEEIIGETNSSYTVTEADKGHYIFAKIIANAEDIIEGGNGVLGTYPEDSLLGVNIGEGFYKTPRSIFFGENFDDKAYAWTTAINTGTKTFKDEKGNEIIRYNSQSMLSDTVKDPAGREGKAFELTAKYTESDAMRSMWFDHNSLLKNDGLKDLHIYEQEIYLDDKALKNDGMIMAQFLHTNDTGKILYAIRDDGFNTSHTSLTPLVEYKLPRNEWFNLITILDFEGMTYSIKIKKANGETDDIMSAALPDAAFKTNGVVRVRSTYQESVSESFKEARVYFDNINYYSTNEKAPDETLGMEHNPYLIANEEELKAFIASVNADSKKLYNKNGGNMAVSKLCARLTADIDVTADIGTLGYAENGVKFCYGGYFNGNGYKVSGLKNPLIAESGEGLNVKALTLEGESTSAGFVKNANADIVFTDCINKVTVISDSVAGGFVADAGSAVLKLTRCANYADITAKNGQSAGGFVGKTDTEASSFVNCINCAAVNATKAFGISEKGYVKNSFYKDEATTLSGIGIAKTGDEFISGEVAYLLNQGAKSVIYGQKLGADSYPLIGDNNAVYYVNSSKSYSNNNGVFLAADREGLVVSAFSDAYAYIAQYTENDEKLTSVEIIPVSADIKEYAIIPEINADACKVFIWDENNVPLAKDIEVDINNLTDFTVEIPEGRDAVVLQLTDTQIIDVAQRRTEDRIGGESLNYWATDKIEERCFQYIEETVKETNPDLILLTGDIIYGEFDDSGRAFEKVVNYMESLNIPWAPIMGNHETESAMGADWQCEMLENAKNCLFSQRVLTGNGNYTVGLKQGNKLLRVFFMLDSNGTKNMSAESYLNGHTPAAYGFGEDQIKWYTNTGKRINKISPETKLTFAYHAPIQAFVNALDQYGFDGKNQPVDIDSHNNKKDGDFGYIGYNFTGWDIDNTVYNSIKALGTDSMLSGHIHCVNASVVYDGIRFQFGNKTGVYDQINYKRTDGSIIASYEDKGFPIVGGTVMELSEDDGTISNAYHYYCKNEY